ncbi:predicted protein [Naegleria gruberi]|uniref:Predicted protein n=1 Tax=Naegleria gruberi TaxID=5762 RepID=D2V9J1_NAEGR|nr:uncharacterized protein NAEGRDRAFT_79079 [Naegleria gruberi]EFC46470.1 predicted protein [Naegleria gruberi]|eukprot:XP_002679214.1 predicted protein [Naegleria gruberi strain NEG-M]
MIFLFSNICGAVTNPSTAVCTVDAQAYQYAKQYNLCYPIGQKGVPKISFLNPADENAGVKVVHAGIPATDGVTRQLAVSLTCDTTAADRPTLTFTGESKEGGIITYGFSGKTKTACPGAAPAPTPEDDLPLGWYGFGGLIMTLALVAFILYFIIGFLVLKFKMQKTGTEAIPQFAFWKDLPFLFIDGVMLPVDLIKGAMGKKNYQEMA